MFHTTPLTDACVVELDPGRRGLYRAIGGEPDETGLELAMLWVLALSDGTCSLLDIATRSGLRFRLVRRAAGLLNAHALLDACTSEEAWEAACASS